MSLHKSGMDMRQITDSYFVSPQLNPEDMVTAASQGIATVIANRPDEEVPATHQADVLQAAAEAAGLVFVRLPVTHQTMTPETIEAHAAAISNSSGPVLAYCASGTRSTVIWALGTALAGKMTPDEIISAAARGGYDLSGMRNVLSGK